MCRCFQLIDISAQLNNAQLSNVFNLVHQGDRGGVQDLMHSLPESLQQFDLHLYSTKVSDLG